MCPRFVVASAITFADGTLTINLPEGNYFNGCTYCIYLNGEIPDATTINAPVVVTIGDGTATYPMTGCNCAQLTACALRARTKYAVKVATSGAGGSFRVQGRVACAPNNVLEFIDGTPQGGAAGE